VVGVVQPHGRRDRATHRQRAGRGGNAVSGEAALEIRGLTVGYAQHREETNTVVLDVDLTLGKGEILGLAGESGCGKSTTALAAIGYRSGATRIIRGSSSI